MANDQAVADGLREAIEPVLEHERNRAHCIGCDFDDMTDEFWSGRVPAVRLGDGLAEPVHYMVPREGHNDD